MKKVLVIVVGVFLAGALLFMGREVIAPTQELIPADVSKADVHEPTLSVGDKVLSIELADTDESRELGLGGREGMSDDAGMLFVFQKPGFPGIWMSGMRFSLDILWLTAEKDPTKLVVVDMKENIAPETYPAIFLPKNSASYVLEMSAGAAAKNGIKVGSVLTLER